METFFTVIVSGVYFFLYLHHGSKGAHNRKSFWHGTHLWYKEHYDG